MTKQSWEQFPSGLSSQFEPTQVGNKTWNLIPVQAALFDNCFISMIRFMLLLMLIFIGISTANDPNDLSPLRLSVSHVS